jgi:dynactin complex subunit
MVTKLLQNNSKVLLMLFFILEVDQNIINEDHDKLVQLWHEYGVYQVHKMYMSINESKQHNQILIQPIPNGEVCFRNIL